MRWRIALCGLAVPPLAVLLWSWIAHSVDELSPRFSDPMTPALTSRVRARAAAVPLPAALLDPQRDFSAAVPVSAAVVPVVSPPLPQRCTEAWIPGVAVTRCVQTRAPHLVSEVSPMAHPTMDWAPQTRQRRGICVLVTRTGWSVVRSCWRSLGPPNPQCDNDFPKHWHEHLAGGYPCAWYTVPTGQRCPDGISAGSSDTRRCSWQGVSMMALVQAVATPMPLDQAVSAFGGVQVLVLDHARALVLQRLGDEFSGR